MNRFEGELINDIPEFLSENWALALYHDKFSQLVINLKAILHEKDIFDIVGEVIGKEKPFDRVDINKILEKVGKRTKSKIEYEIVNFLNENRNHLPFYHIPYLQPPEDGQTTNDEDEKILKPIFIDNYKDAREEHSQIAKEIMQLFENHEKNKIKQKAINKYKKNYGIDNNDILICPILIST